MFRLQVVEMKLLERGEYDTLFRGSQPLPTQRVPPRRERKPQNAGGSKMNLV